MPVMGRAMRWRLEEARPCSPRWKQAGAGPMEMSMLQAKQPGPAKRRAIPLD
jgi:hypothetical protein